MKTKDFKKLPIFYQKRANILLGKKKLFKKKLESDYSGNNFAIIKYNIHF